MSVFAQKQNQSQQPSGFVVNPRAKAKRDSRDDLLSEWNDQGSRTLQRGGGHAVGTPSEGRSSTLTLSGIGWSLSKISMLGPGSLGLQSNSVMDAPGDRFERQADQVAEQVVAMSTPAAAMPVASAISGSPPGLQRKCACGGTCSKCQSEEHDHTEEPVQRKPAASNGVQQAAVPAAVRAVLQSSGRPMDADTRAFMEPRFGRNFGDIRIHAGAEAASSAEAIFARAYTSGRHIVFGAGQYRPESAAGRKLLAHELTHVVQQGGRSASVQRAPDKRWVHDETAARYRGKLLADRIRKHGKVSAEAKTKMASELEYFEGAAHDAYLQVVSSAVRAVVPTEMSATDTEAKPPEPAAPMPASEPKKPKTCSRLPDASGGKKCKFFVYDSMLSDNLGTLWKDAAIADAMFRPATYVVPSGENMERLLENILNAYAEKDCGCTDEVQFWSHGSSGNGGYISGSTGGAPELTAKSFDIPGVDKFGDDRRVPGYQEWNDKLTPLQRRLVVLRRTICDSDSTIYYRSCQGFQGAKGKDFAKASSEFFRCDVAGHTKNIGLTQPGRHVLSPCQEPDWSDSEGVDEVGKKGADKLRHEKPG